MNRIARSCIASLAAAALFVGCAATRGTPAAQTQTAGATCDQLDARIASAEDAKRTALEKQQGAWKAVVPFAVAARYASGKSAADEADEQLGQLRSQLGRQGCNRHDN